MDAREFERLVRRLAREVPAEFLDGVVAIDVSPSCVPHPVRGDVYTLGECVPLHGEGDEIQSRVLLYHGSFQALADGRTDFAWRDEAWETLTHELRHHLEWRANADALESFDWAADQNFARQAGQAFDPLFHLSGEQIAEHVYRIDDDVFLDRPVRSRPGLTEVWWHGGRYVAEVPGLELPLFLCLDGLRTPPPGDVILVLRRRPRLWDLLRRSRPATTATVRVRPAEGAASRPSAD
jgi:hypothetical protein